MYLSSQACYKIMNVYYSHSFCLIYKVYFINISRYVLPFFQISSQLLKRKTWVMTFGTTVREIICKILYVVWTFNFYVERSKYKPQTQELDELRKKAV